MSGPERIESTFISDGKGGSREIRAGCQVELIDDPDPEAAEEKTEQQSEDAYFKKIDLEFNQSWLGPGPFTVSWIGRWPCGRVMLYINAREGESGAYATDFYALN